MTGGGTASGGGRSAWIAAGVVVVLIIAATNLSGEKNTTSRITAEEVALLRERVADLEAKLGAKFSGPSSTSSSSSRAAAAAASGTLSSTGGYMQRPAPLGSSGGGGGGSSSSGGGAGVSTEVARVVAVEQAPPAAAAAAAAAAAGAAGAAGAAALPERVAPKVAMGVVPTASWWTDKEVQTANGEWCRKPPPYAMAKPPLPRAPEGTDRPGLTTELAKRHASKDNMLIATYVNYNRLDFAYTFVKHLVALGNPHFLVGALDEKALRGLQSNGIPSFLIDSGLTTNDYGWGTYAFRQLGLHKVQLVLNLAKTGVDALTVDADAFILRDPFPYIRKLAKADVLMSSDHLVATNGYNDDGIESASGFYSAFNIGYIFIKANSLEFVEAWRDTCYRRKNDWDQVLFSQVLSQGSGGRTVDRDRLRPMYKRKDGTHVMAGVLPVSLFASGHTFFVSRMAHLMHTHPYMVHTTFQYGGAQGKRHRLRESMVWEDEPDYYAAENFLVFEPDLPYSLVYPKGGKVGADGTQPFDQRGSVEDHFALVHHQLTQIRNGFALAKALGRILILPRLVCGLDRWWAPHSGIIPGSAARLPLLECPADHVIDLERMGKPEKVLREASMLCNPRTPAHVLASTATVDAKLRVAVTGDGSNAAEARPEGMALVERLRQKSGVKVLRLSSTPPDYRAVLGAGEVEPFEGTMRGYASLWCCNRPPGGRGAGHIWYDFLWDVVPHRDRFNRKWDDKWFPKMGP